MTRPARRTAAPPAHPGPMPPAPAPPGDAPLPEPRPVPEQLPPREPVTPVRLRRVLREVFGLRALRPGQHEVITRVLDGLSTLAVMPTGAGKSLCFQLPAVLRPGLTVVISPLIALMKDQCDSLHRLGVAAFALHSALTAAEQQQALDAVESGRARLLFTTPERLADEALRARLQAAGVGLLVVDEAHCLAQWGLDFRPAFSALREARQALGRPPVLALTATASPAVQREIAAALGIPREGILSHGVYRPTLRLAVAWPQTEAERRETIRSRLQGATGSALVYCATVREATALHRHLAGDGRPAGLYHGKLPTRARQAAQDAFMHGDTPVMVATNAFGMGIDKPDIRLVLHAQMPASIEAYVQESGRAGRDGEPADALLLFREGDRALQQFFTGGSLPSREELTAVWQALASRTPQGGWLPAALAQAARLPQRRLDQALAALRRVRALRGTRSGGLQAAAGPAADAVVDAARDTLVQRQQQDRDGLEAMVLYAKAGDCRWRSVLAHFGEALPEGQARCGHCDSCERWARWAADARLEAQPPAEPPGATALRAFSPGQRVRVRRFGWGLVVDSSAESVRVAFPRHGERDIHPDFVHAGAAPPA